MKTLFSHKYFAALFVTIAILSLAPTLAHADQQSQPGAITINMTGQATAIGNGLSGASTLSLTANAYRNSNQWLMIQNVTGSLQIGSTTFQIIGGQGSVSTVGAVAIFANTNSGNNQLILIGTMNGQTLTFNSPQSQLASTSTLALAGTINGNIGSTSSLSSNSANTNETSTASTTALGNSTQTTNSTLTSSAAGPLNTTSTQSRNMTSTTNANSTLSTTLNSSNNSTSSTNSTTPASVNVPPSSGLRPPANVTVTTTAYGNQITSVTQTVANMTISYTVTSTVANTTITQANATTTVNTTTNTTSTGP
jgi:hypothetical protein